MSKILCIPDLHGRKFWRKTIDKYNSSVDKIIFLGDYLDPYPNEIKENPELMECKSFNDVDGLLNLLKDIISLKKNESEKYILLTGNHSDSYIWSEFTSATRTDNRNWEKYHNIFLENLSLFNLVWIENDTIFSHAGITKEWANTFLYRYMKYDISAQLEKDSMILETAIVLRDTLLQDFNKHYLGAINRISYHRGGDSMNGSCEWADLMEHIDHYQSEVQEKIVPIDSDNGIYQVFGHTQLQKPLITDKWACLDCRQGFIVDTITHEITACEI